MDEKEFLDLMSQLKEYLSKNKTFIQNPVRVADVQRALDIAREIFLDAEDISLEDDPLQMGAMIISIKDFDLTVRGEHQIELFQELISKTNNFEIYPSDENQIKLSMVFSDVLVRIG